MRKITIISLLVLSMTMTALADTGTIANSGEAVTSVADEVMQTVVEPQEIIVEDEIIVEATEEQKVETVEEIIEKPVIFGGEAELIYEEEVPAVVPSGDYQSYAYSLFPSYGWSDYDFECLVALWNRESGWNPYAENPSSGAYGIPQSLPASKMASAGDDYLTNGYTQINWGLNYIAGRYGNPANAWAHSESTGWY